MSKTTTNSEVTDPVNDGTQVSTEQGQAAPTTTDVVQEAVTKLTTVGQAAVEGTSRDEIAATVGLIQAALADGYILSSGSVAQRGNRYFVIVLSATQKPAEL